MVIAYSYIRFSHRRQKGNDSVRRQKKASADLCKRRGWVLDESLKPDEGISARRGKNAATGALASFLAKCEGGDVKRGSILIVESLDRLSRDFVMEALTLFQNILRHGVTVVTIQPEREYSWEGCNKNPYVLHELLAIMVRANEENETKARRVKESWSKRREQKKHTVPHWLKDANKPIPERVAVLKRIFNLALEGNGVNTIMKMLNREGVKCWARKMQGKKSEMWEMGYIRRLLRNKAVLGYFKNQPSHYKPVIAEELFWRVQGVLNQRRGKAENLKAAGRKGNGTPNLFQKIMFDARSGTPMHLRRSDSTYMVLVAAGAAAGLQPWIGFSYQVFEDTFLYWLEELKLDVPTTNKLDVEIETLEGKIGEQKERLKRLVKALEEEDSETLLTASRNIEKALKANKEQLERLKAELPGDKGEEVLDAKKLIGRYRAEGRMDELREMLANKIKAVVSEIWVLIESDYANHRRLNAQVFLRAGGFRWIYIEKVKNKVEIGSTTDKEGEWPIDLRKWRFEQ